MSYKERKLTASLSLSLNTFFKHYYYQYVPGDKAMCLFDSRPGHSYDCSIYNNIYNTVDSIGVIIIKFGQQETNMDDHKNNCSGIVYYDIV